MRSSGSFDVEVFDYDFGEFVVPPAEGVLVALTIRLRGLIARPVNLGPAQKTRLIILAHGRHSALIENFRGLEYLASHLASHGYTCASIDLNDTVAPAGNLVSMKPQRITGAAIFHRAQAILNTISAFRTMPPLESTVDFKRVGLIGHSRGGEAICRAAEIDANSGSNFGISAALSIAPVDFTVTNISRPLFLLYGDLDGDVSDGQSLRIGDRARGPRFGLYLRGAVHNLFSSNWDNERDDLPSGGTLDRTQHENMARAYSLAFFERFLNDNTDHDAVLAKVAEADAAGGLAAERLYPPVTAIGIDGFEGAFDPSVNGLGLPNSASGEIEFREIDTAPLSMDIRAVSTALGGILQTHQALAAATQPDEQERFRMQLAVLSQGLVPRLRHGFEATSPQRRQPLQDAITTLVPGFDPAGAGWAALTTRLAEEAPGDGPVQTLFDAAVAIFESDHAFNHSGKALSLEWSNSDAVYISGLGGFDATPFDWLHFRAGQDHRDRDDPKSNTSGAHVDLTVELRDDAGAQRSVSIGAADGPLLAPSADQATFKTILHTVMLPLAEFADGPGGIDLARLAELRIRCDRAATGNIAIDNLGFSRIGVREGA